MNYFPNHRSLLDQPMGIVLITPPAGLPLNLTEVKEHLRIEEDQTEQDDRLTAMIGAAAARVEDRECWIQLVTAAYELRLPCFPPNCEPIVIPRPPLQSVESIKYIDTDGNLQTFGSSPITEYVVDAKSTHTPVRGEIHLAHGQSWPRARHEHNAVRIRFTCGFTEPPGISPITVAPDLPNAIRQWMFILIGAMHTFRESEIVEAAQVQPLGFVDGLLDPFRANRIA